eukprot:931255-Amorphochlora_amoeboformis.AAC.1
MLSQPLNDPVHSTTAFSLPHSPFTPYKDLADRLSGGPSGTGRDHPYRVWALRGVVSGEAEAGDALEMSKPPS